MTRLTAVVLAYNETHHIKACLETLAFADQRVVFDSYSTDDTVDIARASGAIAMRHHFENFAAQRNAALEAIAPTTDWVLFVDADERVSPTLAEEIRLAITQSEHAAWRIPRDNYIFGKLTKGAGWRPDYQTRLLKSGYAHYDPTQTVHEIVDVQGSTGTLTQPFIHYNYENVAQFRAKQRKYLRMAAQMSLDAGVQPKFYSPLTMAARHFWWRFVNLAGYRDGWHGLHLSGLMAWYKYREIRTLQGLWGARANTN